MTQLDVALPGPPKLLYFVLLPQSPVRIPNLPPAVQVAARPAPLASSTPEPGYKDLTHWMEGTDLTLVGAMAISNFQCPIAAEMAGVVLAPYVNL